MKLTPARQLGTQRYFIQEVIKGLEEGVHDFVGLKGRQAGVTTITAALDLFWHYRHSGMQGTFASHNEEARDNFRSMMTMYHEGLPKTHRQPLLQNNRHFMAFKNRSRLAMQVAGGIKRQSSGGKGRGQAFTFVHGTECSSWSDEEHLASMIASLAQMNPTRLFIWESTARGFNLFHDMWTDAKRAVTQKAIFVGWWRNGLYRKEKDSDEYRVYWSVDPRLTAQERTWTREVKLLYDFDIEPEQIAWWRWMLAEQITSEDMLLQEHPHDEKYAFILSGKNFFAPKYIDDVAQRIKSERRPEYYLLRYGSSFLDTECEETIEHLAQLTVWEQPDDTGYYALGCDPAYGSSNWADRFVISVWRCYGDRFEQVAEFCVTDLDTYRYAWVLIYLAGAYKNSYVNLEVNGPGHAVLAEINNLRRMASSLGRAAGADRLTNVMRHMQYYLFRRLDSPGGQGAVYHTNATANMKERMLNNFRDILYRGAGRIHSTELVSEMKIFVRDDEGFLEASGRGKDDRVIAASLAAAHYVDQIKNPLERMGITWAKEAARRERVEHTGAPETPQQTTLTRSVRGYLTRMGVSR